MANIFVLVIIISIESTFVIFWPRLNTRKIQDWDVTSFTEENTLVRSVSYSANFLHIRYFTIGRRFSSDMCCPVRRSNLSTCFDRSKRASELVQSVSSSALCLASLLLFTRYGIFLDGNFDKTCSCFSCSRYYYCIYWLLHCGDR